MPTHQPLVACKAVYVQSHSLWAPSTAATLLLNTDCLAMSVSYPCYLSRISCWCGYRRTSIQELSHVVVTNKPHMLELQDDAANIPGRVGVGGEKLISVVGFVGHVLKVPDTAGTTRASIQRLLALVFPPEQVSGSWSCTNRMFFEDSVHGLVVRVIDVLDFLGVVA
jgi:hypothetical protein